MRNRILIILLVGLLVFTSACNPKAAATATLVPTATVVPPTATAIPPTNTPVPPTATPVPTATTAPTNTPVPAPVLEIVGVDGTAKSFTIDDIKALPATEGQAGTKSSTGKISLPVAWKGVALKDLAATLGTFDDSMGINLVANDGYAITFSYDQVMNGTFIQYDPGTGDELKSPVPLTAILAYERDSKPLDTEIDGNLRLVVVSDEPKQVVDGHWSVKWVTKLEIKSVGESWNLHLEGAINELMDRATFESGASPNCHGVTWTDDKAQDWVGIPLWLLVGRVDDDVKHEGPAFNEALADAGYTVDVIASDGYTVSFESSRLKRNDNIIVAHLVNGNPLPEKYYPLRLVGSDLQKNEMAGMIVQIVVHVPAAPAATEAPAPTATTAPAAGGEANLTITGLVENELSLSDADLRALDVVQITAEHPKKGPQDYEGVRLSTLLDLAKVKPEATKLVITASDGFTAEVFLAEVLAIPDCLVAFTDEPGVFNMVMPTLPSSVWTKGVVKIEVK
jgi:DMSO/TMAO reductase YedYZ molybdopterin-dependent catalytic subunit